MFKNILIPTDGSRAVAEGRRAGRGARQGGRRQGHGVLRRAAGHAGRLSQQPSGRLRDSPASTTQMIEKTAAKYLELIERAAKKARRRRARACTSPATIRRTRS